MNKATLMIIAKEKELLSECIQS